jgi:hypothetical protein
MAFRRQRRFALHEAVDGVCHAQYLHATKDVRPVRGVADRVRRDTSINIAKTGKQIELSTLQWRHSGFTSGRAREVKFVREG